MIKTTNNLSGNANIVKAQKAKPALVAVITRTKNRPLLLERAIKSVMQQSMSDLIMIIINDGGERLPVDNLVKKYRSIINGRIKVIHNETSHGMEAASNIGIKSSNSDFLVIHDDDDSWHPSFLESTVSYLNKFNSQGVVTRTMAIIEDVSLNDIRVLDRHIFLQEVSKINYYEMLNDNRFAPISFLYRRSVIGDIGYYDESLPVLGDWDFNLRFLQKYDIGFLESSVPLANYHHRFNATGVMGNTIISGVSKHHEYHNILSNRYLRQSLGDGHDYGLIQGVSRLNARMVDEFNLLNVRIVGIENRISPYSLEIINNRLTNIENLILTRTSPYSLAHRFKGFITGLPKRLCRMVWRKTKQALGMGRQP